MKYKELTDLGFERFDMDDGFDCLGFNDFYLHLKVSKKITFEWSWKEKDIIRMVHYKGPSVQNYIEILDMKTLKALIYLYKEKVGNSGTKPKI